MNVLLRHIILALTLLGPFTAMAQPGWEVGANIGAAYYFGDLNPEFNLSKPGVAGNVFARYNFDNRISLKSGFYYGRIKGDDASSANAFRRARNLDFFSDVFDGTIQLEFNFFEYIHGSRYHYFTPYIFGGLSAFGFSPKTKLDGQTFKLRDFGTEGQDFGDEYSTFSLAMTYGAGLKWDINYYWSMNLELSGRFLFTDYLDDVSTVYPNQTTLAAIRGPEAAALSDRSLPELEVGVEGNQRGNSKNNDSYNFATVGVAYYFGRVKCPEVSKIRQKKKTKSKKGY